MFGDCLSVGPGIEAQIFYKEIPEISYIGGIAGNRTREPPATDWLGAYYCQLGDHGPEEDLGQLWG